MGYFIFKGYFTSNTAGIEIEEIPKITKPQRRADIYSVPGRSGNIIVPQDAWDDVTITYHCWANPAGRSCADYASELAEQLKSDGYASLYDSYTMQYRMAYLSAPIEFDVVQDMFLRFDLVFTCHPQIYLPDGLQEQEIMSHEPLTINNISDHDAYPLLHIIEDGILTITQSDMTVQITIYGDVGSPDVYIDCETGAMYEISDGVKSKTMRVEFDGTTLPVLYRNKPVTFSWSGGGRAFIQTRYWQL